MAPKLSRMQKVQGLKGNIFNYEEKDFTPYIRDNLDLVGEVLGISMPNEMTLEMIEQEYRLNGANQFRADIVATIDDKTMVIENQFDSTDHDHLGKIITYSTNLNADYVVWIVERARKEHKDAIDVLNKCFNDGDKKSRAFFLIELEFWQIDNGPCAPRLNLVAMPDEWKIDESNTKQSKTARENPEIVEFWESFNEFEENIAQFSFYAQPAVAARIGQYAISINSSKYRIQLKCQASGIAACINSTNRETTEKILANKAQIEEFLSLDENESIEFPTLDKNTSSTTSIKYKCESMNKDRWDEYFKWYLKLVPKLKAVCDKFLKD